MRVVRIGFDVDGVLAAFIPSYERKFVEVTGRNTFPGTPESVTEWNWPSLYGYTREETSEVWKRIKADSYFWRSLRPEADFPYFRQWFANNRHYELYFVTNRMGIRPKYQTEQWFVEHLGAQVTVLISEAKGSIAKALNLDFYIDDKAENILHVQELSPTTFAYLLDRPYNQHRAVNYRTPSLVDFLKRVDDYAPQSIIPAA